MRRGTGLAILAAAVCVGAATGLGVRAATTQAAHPGPPSSRVTASPRTSIAAPGSTPTASVLRDPVDLLLTPTDLAVAGTGAPVPHVTAENGVQRVSPCQGDDEPFVGLPAATGRWSGGRSAGRGGEVVVDAATAAVAEDRALVVYQRHVACRGVGVTVGGRHSVVVDGGGITWFPVEDHGVAGYSCVIRIVNRFALLYVDATGVAADRLPDLLRAAADRLR